MRTVKIIFASFILLITFAACDQNHGEEVVPTENVKIEPFHQKNGSHEIKPIEGGR